MTNIRRYALLGLLSSAALWAQGGPPPGPPGRGFGLRPEMGGGPGFGMRGGKVVTNAPYSADVSFSRVQTLADGNTIQHSGTGKVARDAQGRTYSSETFNGGPLGQNGPVTRVSIFDPVAGYAYELDAATKTAVRRAIRQHEGGGPKDRQAPPPNPDVVKTDMGSQLMNGVMAQGTKRTRTIPAGAMGNAQPIVSTTEIWTSTDLQVVVSATHSDPRAGNTSYALSNIVKAAPPASLFQVPAEYTVEDAPKGHRGFGPPGPPPQE